MIFVCSVIMTVTSSIRHAWDAMLFTVPCISSWDSTMSVMRSTDFATKNCPSPGSAPTMADIFGLMSASPPGSGWSSGPYKAVCGVTWSVLPRIVIVLWVTSMAVSGPVSATVALVAVTTMRVAGIGAFAAMPSLFTVAMIPEPGVMEANDTAAPGMSTIFAAEASIATVPFANLMTRPLTEETVPMTVGP